MFALRGTLAARAYAPPSCPGLPTGPHTFSLLPSGRGGADGEATAATTATGVAGATLTLTLTVTLTVTVTVTVTVTLTLALTLTVTVTVTVTLTLALALTLTRPGRRGPERSCSHAGAPREHRSSQA